jgi:hypothetical protein
LWFVQIDFFTITYSAEVPMSAAIGDRQLLGFMMWFVSNSGVTVPEIEALFSEPQRGPNDIFWLRYDSRVVGEWFGRSVRVICIRKRSLLMKKNPEL